MVTEHAAFLLLLNWMSPTFPIGSFAYSHGLEQAIADGRLKTAQHVETWIVDLLRHGSLWNDAVIFARCGDADVPYLNDTALALASSRERYLETTQLGRSFSIAAATWTGNEKPEHDIAYPVAAGAACKDMGIAQEQAVLAFLQSACAALVSVAVRLVPLGQSNGLAILRNLAPVIAATALRASEASICELGTCCVASDIAAMQHETLEPRVFRT